MQKFYSNGKLLLSGEYLVLDGAVGLALPTAFGQEMILQESTSEGVLLWNSLDDKGNSWFKGNFSLPDLELISYKGDKDVATTLQRILLVAKKANNHFLSESNGLLVTTNLQFPGKWGLGSSSTLINNIAQWSEIDAFQLLFDSFGGSGYDIACAKTDQAILYQLHHGVPQFEPVNFDPEFKNQLFFVHLNKKQVSSESIKIYKKKKVPMGIIDKVSTLSKTLLAAHSLHEFEQVLKEHESILSGILEVKPIKQRLFPDFAGQVKSLGAWGGDFVLATGDELTTAYFNQKGFKTVVPYNKMIKTA